MYLKNLKLLNPQLFVEPDTAIYETDARTSLVTHFAPVERASVGVLVADPGQGKTHMTRRLAANPIPSGTIPLYVDSRQWANLSNDALADLWRVISATFEHFDAPMPWIAGKEYDFFAVTMKAGLFALIFDGFDEYIYKTGGRADAVETLETLVSLADEADARMLLTSRTTFWQNDILRHGKALPPHVRYAMRFDRTHAKTYFDTSLATDPVKASRALQLFDSLSAQDEDFVGRGFVLALLADLVQRSDTIPVISTTDSVTRRVMAALCERERVRQKLQLTAEQQLHALGTFAVQVAARGTATTDVLETAIGLTASLDDDAMRETVGDKATKTQGKLAVHPLIEYDGSARAWHIRQDQVFYNLLADQLLSCTSTSDPTLRDFVEKILPDAKLRAEIASVVIDQACGTDSVGAAKQRVRETIKRLLEHSSEHHPTVVSMPERDLATTMALLMVNRFVPVGKPRDERRDELLWYFDADRLNGLQLSGTVTGISFKGLIFRNCRFELVTFLNCEFDETTMFEHCRFIGGRLEYCEGFGKAAFVAGWRDPDAAMLIESHQVLARQRPYTELDLERDIGLLVQKFAHKDSFGVKSIEERYLRSGRFSYSPKRDEIIAAFHRFVIERHEISRKRAGVNIRPSARGAVMFYVNNGVLTGALAQVRDEVTTELD